MAKFMFVYRGSDEEFAKLSPEELQKHMQQWGAWIEEGFTKGWLLNAGDALTPEGRCVSSKMVVTDGPFVESKEVVGGYSVVEADTIDAAAIIAKGCPGLLAGGIVEVRPLAGLAAKP
jgi:hypothetical protein